jgi:hypothetical protein
MHSVEILQMIVELGFNAEASLTAKWPRNKDLIHTVYWFLKAARGGIVNGIPIENVEFEIGRDASGPIAALIFYGSIDPSVCRMEFVSADGPAKMVDQSQFQIRSCSAINGKIFQLLAALVDNNADVLSMLGFELGQAAE